MEYNEFKEILLGVTSATSIEGRVYTNIYLKDNEIYYKRESGSAESISARELFTVYKECNYINTSILRKYITGRKFSPSNAILRESGLFDDNGYRNQTIVSQEKDQLIEQPPIIEETEISEKAEGRFFAALANILDSKFVKAKSLNKQVSNNDVVLFANHVKMSLPDSATDKMQQILQKFGNNSDLNNDHLERHIDGMVVGHPTLGTRIVEFDEEQHFTPARLDSLRILKEIDDYPFIDLYITICSSGDYLNDFVLPKHRIKDRYITAISGFKDLQKWLENITPQGKKNGYIGPKPGFDFIGGRIAQRAYYDTLRDVAHLSAFNKSKLLPIIRFPKVYVTLKLKKDFDQVSIGELQNVIKEYMQEYYNIKL